MVDHICRCTPAIVRRELESLPESLGKTYERALREIDEIGWKIAHSLLQFVAVASRPLRIEELAELFAFDFEKGPIPKFHEGWRLEDPVHAVLSTCSSLLTIVDRGDLLGKVIQFSHISVKEFLTSTHLAEASDIILRRYHVSMTPAHTLAAQACLGILLYLDKDVVTSDDLGNWPLAKYAAEYWAYHSHFEGVSQNVEDGMKQLTDPRKSTFCGLCRVTRPRTPHAEGKRTSRKALTTFRNPLALFCSLGLIWAPHRPYTDTTMKKRSNSTATSHNTYERKLNKEYDTGCMPL
jgi:hypothetical protein